MRKNKVPRNRTSQSLHILISTFTHAAGEAAGVSRHGGGSKIQVKIERNAATHREAKKTAQKKEKGSGRGSRRESV